MRTSFHTPFPSPSARKRVAVFHHAGGSGLSFLRLAKGSSRELEFRLAEFPGRGLSSLEAPPSSVQEFAKKCAEELLVEPPGIALELFGHSMGATVAFEVAKLMPGRIDRLVVSSSLAPSSRLGSKDTLPLTERELNEVLDRYGVLAKEQAAARAYVMPLLKIDLELLRQYPGSQAKLDAPILALGGREDEMVSEGELRAWELHTQKGFELRMQPGGHFYVWDDPHALERIF